MLSQTLDYLPLPIQSDVPIGGLDVEVSISVDSDTPSLRWYPAEHTDSGVQVLIGPGSTVGQLDPGIWYAFVRVNGLLPRLPIIPAGGFVIEGTAPTEHIIDGGTP